jgi:hypothetical protein
MTVVTKSAFAALCGVSRARVAQWISCGQVDGEAIVGSGHRARIDADIARAQLKERLDVSQWRVASRARLDGTAKVDLPPQATAAPTVEAEIKAAHLRRIELANAKAEGEAAIASGRYLVAEDVRREVGAIAGSMVAAFEGMIPQFADAVAANWAAPQPDVLHLLRGVWRAARARQSALDANPAHAPDTVSEAALGRSGRS